MKGVPEYGFKCPKCTAISAGPIWTSIERYDSICNWKPEKNDFEFESKSPVEVDGGSGWRCPACDARIGNPRECLVQLTVTRLHEPTDVDVDAMCKLVEGTGFDSSVIKSVLKPEPTDVDVLEDPKWLKDAMWDKPPGNPAEDDAENLGQEPDY